MAKILIAGAGDVGSRLALLLVAEGHEVWALKRRPAALPGVQVLTADVTRPETLAALPVGLDVLVVALAPGEPGAEAYRRVYVEGTRNLMQALTGQALRHQFWVSSTSVYGEDAGEWVDEATPAHPASATGRLLLEAEAVARAAPWPCTVLRLGGLYGPGRHRLLRRVDSGEVVTTLPAAWSNRIHVEDAAGLLAHLLRQALAGVTPPPLCLGVDDAPSPQHEVLAWLAQAMARPPLPTWQQPGAMPGAATGKRVRNRALHASGYALRYPDYRAGYAQVLRAAGPAD